MTTRRIFLVSLPAGALAIGMGHASAAVALSEAEPIAVGLGYKTDASKVDVKKYPAFVRGQQCANCQLYAGKPTDKVAPCSIFAGKVVNGKGWWAAWVKKA